MFICTMKIPFRILISLDKDTRLVLETFTLCPTPNSTRSENIVGSKYLIEHCLLVVQERLIPIETLQFFLTNRKSYQSAKGNLRSSKIRMDLEHDHIGQDPFASLAKNSASSGAQNYVHIRNQQRNGRKSLTTVQGLGSAYDVKKICKALKRDFSCNGTVIEHEELGDIIQLQGDQRQNVARFLEAQGLVRKDLIKVHGA